MTHGCRSCGAKIPLEHFLCRRCFSDAARRLKAGQKPATGSRLTLERADELLRLCDPARHDNSNEAIAATAWLLDVRRSLQSEG